MYINSVNFLNPFKSLDNFNSSGYVVDSKTTTNGWYEKILNLTGDGSTIYSHASNVSTLAALFSLGTGIGNPEDLAMAGILHDIGVADLTLEIQSIPYENMNPTQKLEYEKHPELTINMIKNRKLILPEIVFKIIEQHHERFNGTGYPRKLPGDRICKEAQVLGLADLFEELTSIQEGKVRLSPMDAILKLRDDAINDPSKMYFDLELIKQICKLFPIEENSVKAS